MSRWKSGLENQQLNQLITNCIVLLEAAKIEKLASNDLVEYSRLLKVLKVLSVRLQKVDPELFALNTWSNFNPWLNEVQNHVRNFSQNGSIGHIHSANNAADNLLSVLRPLDTGATVEEFKSIADANAAFQQKIVEEFERVRARSNEVKTQLDSLFNGIKQTEVRLTENNTTIQQQKLRLDQSIAEYQKQFSEAQEKRTKDFSQVIQKNSDNFASQSKQFESQFNETSEARKKSYETLLIQTQISIDERIEFFKNRETEVKRIFNVIGNVAVAGDYKNTADHEGVAADRLRITALVLMVLMALIASATFIHSLIVKDVDWKLFGFRLGTTLILAVPALYAAQESAKHREREKLNRKLHLELSAIDAYLELLPVEKRQEIKAKLTERFFGQPEASEKDEPVTKHELFELLSKIIKGYTNSK